jgi:hypothetical protein
LFNSFEYCIYSSLVWVLRNAFKTISSINFLANFQMLYYFSTILNRLLLVLSLPICKTLTQYFRPKGVHCLSCYSNSAQILQIHSPQIKGWLGQYVDWAAACTDIFFCYV